MDGTNAAQPVTRKFRIHLLTVLVVLLALYWLYRVNNSGLRSGSSVVWGFPLNVRFPESNSDYRIADIARLGANVLLCLAMAAGVGYGVEKLVRFISTGSAALALLALGGAGVMFAVASLSESPGDGPSWWLLGGSLATVLIGFVTDVRRRKRARS